MTLRALHQLDGFPGFGNDPTPTSEKQRALVFILDSGYVWPMKVLWHTLIRSGALIDLPIIIATEDAALFQDPVVDVAADVKFLIDRTTIAILDDAAANAKKREGKHAWTRATFLKWSVFRDWGFDELLFLDCDMITVGSLSPIFSEAGDLIGCPQFQKTVLQNPDGRRRDPTEILQHMTRFVHDLKGSPLSLNSGVMLLRKGVLSEAFLKEIVAFTTSVACINEQQYITRFMRSKPNSGLRLISPIYNFQESFLSRLDVAAQIRFLRDIRVLHFAGGNKPWNQPVSQKTSIGQLVWWRTGAEAATYLGSRS